MRVFLLEEPQWYSMLPFEINSAMSDRGASMMRVAFERIWQSPSCPLSSNPLNWMTFSITTSPLVQPAHGVLLDGRFLFRVVLGSFLCSRKKIQYVSVCSSKKNPPCVDLSSSKKSPMRVVHGSLWTWQPVSSLVDQQHGSLLDGLKARVLPCVMESGSPLWREFVAVPWRINDTVTLSSLPLKITTWPLKTRTAPLYSPATLLEDLLGKVLPPLFNPKKNQNPFFFRCSCLFPPENPFLLNGPVDSTNMERQLTSPESLNHPRQSSIIRTLPPEHSLHSVQIPIEPFLFPCQNSFGNFLSSLFPSIKSTISTCMGAYLLSFSVHFLPYVLSSSNHLGSILQHMHIFANTCFQPSLFSPVMIPLVNFSTKI